MFVCVRETEREGEFMCGVGGVVSDWRVRGLLQSATILKSQSFACNLLVCICVYVCMCVCVYVCMCVCVYV